MDHPATKAAGRRAVQLCACLLLLVQILLPLLQGLHLDGRHLQESSRLEATAAKIPASSESSPYTEGRGHLACALCLAFQTQRSSFLADDEVELWEHSGQFVGLIAKWQATFAIAYPRCGQPRAPPHS